jgi:hypothetical protein
MLEQKATALPPTAGDYISLSIQGRALRRDEVNTPSPGRLYAFLLRLRPLGKGTLMPFSGQQVQGAWIKWVKSTAPDVAAWLDEGRKRRPYTCSSLQFPLSESRIRNAERENRHLLLNPEKVYTVRITLLQGDLLFPILYEALLQRGIRGPEASSRPFMQIGEQPFLLEAMVSKADDGTGWAGFSSFYSLVEEIARKVFLPVVSLEMEFASLTAINWIHPEIKTYGGYYGYLPLPRFIFPALARRWQELAPPELSGFVQKERIEDYISAEGMVIDDYELRTHQVHFPRFLQRGFVGFCRYLLRGPDERPPTPDAPLTVRQQIYLLARFAFYAGIGYKPTMGMGQVRMVNPAGSSIRG